MQTTIRSISAREILDSRGEPTLEVKLLTDMGEGVASVPAGASTGSFEALELRDGDQARFHGRGVTKATQFIVGEISAALVGSAHSQETLDAALVELDGTPNRSRLGGNTLLGISMAFARAAARENGLELFQYLNMVWGMTAPSIPQPYFNILNGGMHADSGISVQECMIAPGASSTIQNLESASDVIRALKTQLKDKGLSTGVGDEGGFAPKLAHSEEALDAIVSAAQSAGREVSLALDVAATSFYADGHYVLDGVSKNSQELMAWYQSLCSNYPIVSLEDPFNEDAWKDFAMLRNALAGKVRVVGDDLTVTQALRVAEAVQAEAIDAVIIKPNQAGTVSETLAAARAAAESGIALMVSHRSGDTPDTFVADLAVGVGAQYCKFGSLARGERVAKYNRLCEIEAQLHA